MTKLIHFTSNAGQGYKVRFTYGSSSEVDVELYDAEERPVEGWCEIYKRLDDQNILKTMGVVYENAVLNAAKDYINSGLPEKCRNLYANRQTSCNYRTGIIFNVNQERLPEI